jgi:hypothetical protein
VRYVVADVLESPRVALPSPRHGQFPALFAAHLAIDQGRLRDKVHTDPRASGAHRDSELTAPGVDAAFLAEAAARLFR